MTSFSYLHTRPVKPYRYTTINRAAEENAISYPNQEIFVHKRLDRSRSSITNASLFKQASQLARFLISEGVRKGDTVALVGPNTLETIIGTLGILCAGAVVLNISINMKNAEDAHEMFQLTDTEYLLIDCGENGELLTVANAMLTSSKLHQGNKELRALFLRKFESKEFDNILTLPEILLKSEITAELPEIYPEDPAIIFSTSGSTGEPKLVLHTQFSLSCYPFSWIPTPVNYDIVEYNDRPFIWMGGSPISYIILRKRRVFMDASIAGKGKHTEFIWSTVREEQCTDALLSPYFLLDLIQMSEIYSSDTFKLRHIATGGQIIDDFYTKILKKHCKKLIVVYGITESIAAAIRSPVNQGEAYLAGDVGFAYPGIEIRIVDDNERVVPIDTIGSIHLRGRYTMKEYFKNPELTKKVLTGDGWLKTGDVGKVTPEGTLRFLGRQKDIISRGTRKIYPALLEEHIKHIKEIRYVYVIAVPDKRLGEEICACFAVCPSSNLNSDEVEEYCNNTLLKESTTDGLGIIPKYFLQFDEFPLLGNGKPNKRSIYEEAVHRLGL